MAIALIGDIIAHYIVTDEEFSWIFPNDDSFDMYFNDVLDRIHKKLIQLELFDVDFYTHKTRLGASVYVQLQIYHKTKYIKCDLNFQYSVEMKK